MTITLDSCIKQNIANFIIIYLSYNMLYCGIGFPVHLLAYPGDILHTVKPRYYQAWSVDASCGGGGEPCHKPEKGHCGLLEFYSYTCSNCVQIILIMELQLTMLQLVTSSMQTHTCIIYMWF